MNRATLLSLSILLCACAGPTPEPAPAPTPAPASDPAPTPDAAPPPSEPPTAEPAPAPAGPPSAGESRVLQGVLRYTELPRRKSVEAFLGQDLTLVAGDESWNLDATEQVSQEQLVALDGKRIEVTATYVPPTEPNPMEQAPMDGDQLMKRPARWEVTAVKVLDE